MAPRRGGGSSSGLSSGGDGGVSVTNRCQASIYFEDGFLKWTVTELAISGVSLLAFMVLFGLYIWQVNRRRHASRVVKWWTYGIALGLTIISFILRIINDVLNDCQITEYDTYEAIWITISIMFYGAAWLIWLAISMLPLCLAMLRQARCPTKIFQIVQSVTLGILVIIWLASTVVSSWNSWDQYTADGFDDHDSLVNAAIGLSGTYNTLYFVAVLMTSCILIYALFRLRRYPVSSQGMKIWVPFTMIFFLASTVLSMVEVLHWTVPKRTWTSTPAATTGALDLFFIFGVAFGILFSAASSGFAHSSPPEVAHGDKPPQYAYDLPTDKPEMDGSVSAVGHAQYPQGPNDYNQHHPQQQFAQHQHSWGHQSNQYQPHWQQPQPQFQPSSEMPVQPPELLGQQRYEVDGQPGLAR